jgi:hypothetical protein
MLRRSFLKLTGWAAGVGVLAYRKPGRRDGIWSDIWLDHW